MGVALDIVGNAKSFAILFIAPFISILPDMTLKQLWFNFYPTPSEYIQKYIKSSQVLRLLVSSSRFIKDISGLNNNISQKIEIVHIENNGKLFEKRKSKILDAMKYDSTKNKQNNNFNKNFNNNFNDNFNLDQDTTKLPLKPIETQNNPLIQFMNKQKPKKYLNISENKKIEEMISSEIDCKFKKH